MRKGKYGIAYAFYAVAALITAMLGWVEATVIITLFVIALEQDEWASRQTIAASTVAGLVGIIRLIAYALRVPTSWIYSFTNDFYKFKSIYDGVVGIIEDLLLLTMYIFIVIAIFKVAKEKEAGIPIASKFANWAYGKVSVVVNSAPAKQAAPQQAPQQAAPAVKMCPKCNIPVEGNFCEKCGTKA